jgi:uncharacterized cofD-like protein
MSRPAWPRPIANLRAWLRPGLGIRRWLVVVFIGELGVVLALALLLRQVYRDVEVEGPLQALLYLVTLQFLPYIVRGIVVAALGAALFALGSMKVIQVLMGPFRPNDADTPLVEVIYQKRFLARGPRVVAIGGGTGLSTLLRGLKEHTSNLTAVVTVADDGGSSGRLREQLGVPAVGDIRNCIVALADAEPLMGRLLQYRFPGDEVPESLGGHTIGNLLIAALTAVEGGDFEEGVRQMNRVLAVRGQVLPVSPTPITLHARLRDGGIVDGQSSIARSSGIERVWITPDAVRASDDAVRAIREADLIVVGPGSLYTSILPSLLLPEIRAAIAASAALRVYVCNVATQQGETSGYDLAAHVEALVAHSAPDLVDVVLANNRLDIGAPDAWHGEPVRLSWPPDSLADGGIVPRLVLDDLVDPADAHFHDPSRLAASLIRLAARESGTRRRAPGVARSA